jgi:nicotinate dehydrogenase subunit A
MSPTGLQLQVNGQHHELRADSNTPLLYVLRHELNLKGTRFGCGANQCGACHVLIDGRSLPACDTPLWAVENKPVVTVEGLSASGAMSVLQQAFIDEQAAQCGYCISGILISATELLMNHPDAKELQIREALDKHLCRCGSHNRIVRAVLRAVQQMREKA